MSRKLNIRDSLQVCKFLFSFLEIENGQLVCRFWTLPAGDIAARSDLWGLQDIPGWVRITQSVMAWKGILRQIKSYLSAGNVETPFDIWCADVTENGGNKVAEREALINLFGEEDPSSVAGLKLLATNELLVVEYLEEKMRLGKLLDQVHKNYLVQRREFEGAQNKIIRGISTRKDTLDTLEGLFDNNKDLLDASVNYFHYAPGDAIIDWINFILPNMAFIEDNDIVAATAEIEEENIGLMLRVNDEAVDRRDFQYIEGMYQEDLELYAAISETRNKSLEEQDKVKILVSQLTEETKAAGDEVFGIPEEDFTLGMVLDLIDRVGELRRRYIDIKSSSSTNLFAPIRIEVGFDVFENSIEVLLQKSRVKLFNIKESITEERRTREQISKIKATELGKNLPRETLPHLTCSRGFIVWSKAYQNLRQRLKGSQLEGWRERLKDLVRTSLKNEEDKKATAYMISLGEVESYLCSKYVSNTSIMADILRDIFKKEKPRNNKESIENIQDCITILKTIKMRGLEDKLTENQLAKLIDVCLMRRDNREFLKVWAEKRRKSKLSSTRTEFGGSSDSEDDVELEIDFDRTIKIETEVGTLSEKRKCFKEFLKLKLEMLQDEEADNRLLRNDSPKRYGRKKEERNQSFIKKDGKIFRVVEESDSENEEENVFSVKKGDKPYVKRTNRNSDKTSKYQNCPLDCPEKTHINGSAFFCKVFKNKTREERRLLQKKLFLCIMCLAKESRCKKTCKIGPCKRCGSHHNILLCNQDLTDGEIRAFLANDDKEDDDDDDEEYREALRDENVFISSLRASINKESGEVTNNKKEDIDEQKDDTINQECDEASNSKESEKTSNKQENEDSRDQENAEFAFLQCMQAKPMINDEAETPSKEEEEQTLIDEDNIFLMRMVEKKGSKEAFLVTSVANTRRHLMNNMEKEEEEKTNDLQKHQTLVEEAIKKDGRGIKKENGRKSELSIKKWSNSGRFMEIINETRKGSKQNIEEDPATRSERKENKTEVDIVKKETERNKTMLINVPADNLRNKERIEPEPPPIIAIGPNHEEYDNLLERAVALNERVKSEGKNMSSSIIPVTVFCRKNKTNFNLIKHFELEHEVREDDVMLEIMAISDSGADTAVESEDVRNMIGEQKLEDATCHLKGATGDSQDLDRNILSLVTEDGSIVNIDCRKVEDLGVNGRINEKYEQGVKEEFKMSKEQELLFEFRKKSSKIMLLIGVKSGSLLGKQIEPESLKLQKPVCSPDLRIWKSRLSKKYYITGQLGVQKELIDRKLSYPTFYKPTDDFSRISSMSSKINIKEKINSFSIASDHVYSTGNPDNQNLFSCGYLSHQLQQAKIDLSYLNCSDNILFQINEDPLVISKDILDPEQLTINEAMQSDTVLFTKQDSLTLEKFLQSESSLERRERKCHRHRDVCTECQLLSQSNHLKQSKLIQDIWNNIEAEKQENGKYLIRHNYTYRNDIKQLYSPDKSNIAAARSHSKKIIVNCAKKGQLENLNKQVDKAIDKQMLQELTQDEVIQLNTLHHHFAFFNYVENPNSSSTPFRLVCNTSNSHSQTTMSVEQLTPDSVLNNMEAGLIRFQLFSVPLVADILGAYHCIAVDAQTALLRLMHYFRDPPSCLIPRIFRRDRQAFGDPAASFGLEIACIKFVAAFCLLAVCKYLVEYCRYADNLNYSFETVAEFQAAKSELVEKFDLFSLPLKYCITGWKYDKEVFKDPKRGESEIEKMLGIEWNLRTDCISALPTYNAYGSSRGKILGPNLIDMDDEDIKNLVISRLLWLRICAQSYSRLGNLLAPVIMSCKILASRSCELSSSEEMEVDLTSRDPEFAEVSKQFLLNLKMIQDQVKPFPRALVPEGHKLLGFVMAQDGGRPGFGVLCHSLARDGGEKLYRNVILGRSRVAKRNIPSHEIMSGRVASAGLHTVLEPLLFDHKEAYLEIINLSDSTCSLCLLNPGLKIKNVLISNSVDAWKDGLCKLSVLFPNSTISVGFIRGEINPADYCSKFFSDSRQVLNSTLYRMGPEKYDKLENIKSDIVATFKNGEFTFHGLKPALIGIKDKDDSSEKCELCLEEKEFCGLALTRNQKKMNVEEDQRAKYEMDNLSKQNIQLPKYPLWRGVYSKMYTFAIAELYGCLNLLDPRYSIKSLEVVPKDKYLWMVGHFFRFEQLFRFVRWWILISWFKSGKHITEGWQITKEAFIFILRNSQHHFPVKKENVTTIHGIKCEELRLDYSSAEQIFGCKYLPIISNQDDLRFKMVRFAHENQSYKVVTKGIHYSLKATKSRLHCGAIGVTWGSVDQDVQFYIRGCGLCLSFTGFSFNPWTERSLTRTKSYLPLFSHTSLDPLGPVRVNFDGSTFTKLVYPLILVDINLSITDVVLMQGCTSKDVYLALMLVQDKYKTQIIQIFSDGGSNLLAKNLGASKEYFSEKIGKLISTKNNPGYSQYKNCCERYVKMVKKLIKQAIQGKPGSLEQTQDFSILQFCVSTAVTMTNEIPYRSEKNTDLLSPNDFINPNRNYSGAILELPQTCGLADLKERKLVLIEKMEQLRQTRLMEMRLDYDRFLKTRIKSGRNKSAVNITVGDLISHRANPLETGKFGIVENLSRGTAQVRFRDSTRRIGVAALTPIATQQFALDQQGVKMTRSDEIPSHFLSIEIPEVEHQLIKKVESFQNEIQDIFPGIGKIQKLNTLHLTLGVLKINTDEIEKVKELAIKAFDRFKEHLPWKTKSGRTPGFMMSFRGAGIFMESGSLFLKPSVGSENLRKLRNYIDEELKDYLTEICCDLHLTIMRKMNDIPEEKILAFLNSCQSWETGTVLAESLTLRQMKGPESEKADLLTYHLSEGLGETPASA